MKFKRAKATGNQGEAITHVILPDGWKSFKPQEDTGLDVDVEIVEDEVLTGLRFYCQVKTTKSISKSSSIRDSGEHLSYSLSTEQLSYYVDKVRQPVFIILVVLKELRGYWLSLQEYEAEVLSKVKPGWRNQKSVAILVPKSTFLLPSDPKSEEVFETAVRKAFVFMENKRPGRPMVAIAAKEEGLHDLEPRASFRITATSHGEYVEVIPVQPISFSVRFSGDKKVLLEKLKNLIHRGVPVEFGNDEVQFMGSRIFDEFESYQADRILLQAGRREAVTLVVKLLGSDFKPIGKPLSLSAERFTGTREFSIRANTGNMPVKIIWTERLGKQDPNISFRFDIRFWTGADVCRLQHFAMLEDFLGNKYKPAWMSLDAYSPKSLPSSATVSVIATSEQMSTLFGVLGCARSIARHLGRTVLLKNFTADEAARMLEFASLLETGEFVDEVTGTNLKLTLGKKSIHEILATHAPEQLIQLAFPDYYETYNVMGEEIPFAIKVRHFDKLSLSNRETVEAAAERGADSVLAEFLAVEGCKMSVWAARKGGPGM